MKYYDIEMQEFVTREDLNRERCNLIQGCYIEPQTLDEYIAGCLGKNGTLVMVYENENV